MWIVTTISLVGTVLNARKNRLCFLFWSVGNISWAVYDFSGGVYSRFFLDLVQLALGVYGLIEWSKSGRKGDG